LIFLALGITLFGLDITPQFIPDNITNAVELSSYALSVATTVVSTGVIAIRILMVSRMPGTTHQPQIALEIIVESAALYTISALVYTSMVFDVSPTALVVTYLNYADIFFAYMAVECHLRFLSASLNSRSQNFAPALIMLRVVLGRARPDIVWSKKISALHFHSAPGVQESARSGDATSTILSVPRSLNGEVVDLEANGGPLDGERMDKADEGKASI
jgi:hypothetical protein